MSTVNAIARVNLSLITLAIMCSGVACAQTAPKPVTIDAAQRKPISPYIYGANFPDWQKLGLPFPLARQGGNRLTAYNWENNASNAGADWHHQNDAHLGVSNEPGYYSRIFLQETQQHGAVALLTVPMAGYVAADKNGGGDVNQTPNYLETRFLRSLPKKPGPFVYPPDTTDGVVYQDEFVAFLEKHKKPGTTSWYSLDNEADLWRHTHSRIVPKTPTYAEFIARSQEYAAAIKAVAPNSLVTGPASFGWSGFRNFGGASDANGRNFLDVYLAAMAAAEKQHGKRLLDVLDVHWYPEARGDNIRVTESANNTPATHRARIQASRSLWDPTYVEDSWIAENLGKKPIALLPRLHRQIDTHYPGTKLAITEYSYGGANHISGAIAQADVLGCFGRYGVYAASNWGLSPDQVAKVAGYRAFLNYDGQGSRFGDLGLAVAGQTPADDSVYAALDSRDPKLMTVVVINKTEAPRPMNLQLRDFAPDSAAAYTITADNLALSRPSDVSVKSESVSYTAPPLSVSTLDIRAR